LLSPHQKRRESIEPMLELEKFMTGQQYRGYPLEVRCLVYLM
jgi:hypothetical protein